MMGGRRLGGGRTRDEGRRAEGGGRRTGIWADGGGRRTEGGGRRIPPKIGMQRVGAAGRLRMVVRTRALKLAVRLGRAAGGVWLLLRVRRAAGGIRLSSRNRTFWRVGGIFRRNTLAVMASMRPWPAGRMESRILKRVIRICEASRALRGGCERGGSWPGSGRRTARSGLWRAVRRPWTVVPGAALLWTMADTSAPSPTARNAAEDEPNSCADGAFMAQRQYIIEVPTNSGGDSGFDGCQKRSQFCKRSQFRRAVWMRAHLEARYSPLDVP